MDWAHRFNDTLSYAGKASYSGGNFTYAAATTFVGRLEEFTSVVRGIGGEEVTTSHRVATTTALPEGTRVWLPGRDTDDASESLAVLRQERAKIIDDSYEMYNLYLGR